MVLKKKKGPPYNYHRVRRDAHDLTASRLVHPRTRTRLQYTICASHLLHTVHETYGGQLSARGPVQMATTPVGHGRYET